MHVLKQQLPLSRLLNQLFWPEQLRQQMSQYVMEITMVRLQSMEQQVEQGRTNIASMVQHGNLRIHLQD